MGVGSSRGKSVLTSLAGRGGCLAKGKKEARRESVRYGLLQLGLYDYFKGNQSSKKLPLGTNTKMR